MKENKFWIFWGKLSAVIITIGVLITIYIQIFPSESELIAEDNYYKFALPVDLIDKISLYNTSVSVDSIKKYIREYDEKNKTNMSDEFDFRYYLNNKLGGIFKKFNYNPNYYNGHFYFSIKNVGAKISEDIIFHSPLNGIALITREDDTQTIEEFNRQIKLNSLRPNESLSLAIWSKYFSSFYGEDEFRLTDSNGSGDFSFPTYVTGFAEFVANNLFILIFGLILFLLISFGILIDYCSRSTNENQESKTQAT